MTEGNFLEKTFFPGVRKQLRVETISLLTDRADINRIKVPFSMPLNDGKLTGIPAWLAEGYEHMAKEESQESSIKFAVQLSEMSLYLHTTEDIQHAAQTLFSVSLKDFKLEREETDEEDEELPELALAFVAIIPGNRKVWDWLYPYNKKNVYVRFDTTQPDLADKPKPDTQMRLGDDGYDAARKDATSKAHDADFARAN
jgi:hypothetical protein